MSIKLLLLTILSSVFTLQSFGAIALVANIGTSGTTPITTGSMNSTGANFLVVGIGSFDLVSATSICTPTDSKGNTYTPLTRLDGNFGSSRIWYSTNPTVGTGHTVTVTCTDGADLPAVVAAAFSGVSVTSPFDQQNGAFTGGGVNSIQPGNVTPSEDNELIITNYVYFDVTTMVAINSGFSIIQNVEASGTFSSTLAYLVQTTAGAENPTWSNAVNQNQEATIATFKEFSGSPTVTRRKSTILE